MFEDHVVKLYTICKGRWRIAEEKNIPVVDVTFKSAESDIKKLFAPPSFNLVLDYKRGKITPCEYKEAYIDKLKRTSVIYYDEWLAFLNRYDEVALCCYCGELHGCHREILAEFLYQFGIENDIDVILEGELK